MKLQRIMVDGGFTCPNRDGRVGVGGCTFCRTESYSPDYCRISTSISEQIEAGKRFFAGRYPEMRYLVYFQAFSSTYAPLEVLRKRYEEALATHDVVGLVIGTRPDCLPNEVIRLLAEIISKGFIVQLEIGIESLYDRTLTRINRHHTVADTYSAIERCHDAGIPLGAHMIIGLPGESESDILAEANLLNELPIESLKLHQLQILQGTVMHNDWLSHPTDFLDLTADSYAHLAARFIKQLRPTIRIERYAASAPSHLLIHPRWGLKVDDIRQLILKYAATD